MTRLLRSLFRTGRASGGGPGSGDPRAGLRDES